MFDLDLMRLAVVHPQVNANAFDRRIPSSLPSEFQDRFTDLIRKPEPELRQS
jgi:hypothetical protein